MYVVNWLIIIDQLLIKDRNVASYNFLFLLINDEL